jgi:hypothetical protein
MSHHTGKGLGLARLLNVNNKRVSHKFALTANPLFIKDKFPYGSLNLQNSPAPPKWIYNLIVIFPLVIHKFSLHAILRAGVETIGFARIPA